MEGLDQMRNLSLKQCIHITAKRYARERVRERERKSVRRGEGRSFGALRRWNMNMV